MKVTVTIPVKVEVEFDTDNEVVNIPQDAVEQAVKQKLGEVTDHMAQEDVDGLSDRLSDSTGCCVNAWNIQIG